MADNETTNSGQENPAEQTQKTRKKKTAPIALALVAVGGIGTVGLLRHTPKPAIESQPQVEQQTTPVEIEEVKIFNVTASNFAFGPNEIRVKKGDHVKIMFTNESGFHDWVLDEFNVRTPQMKSPGTAEVEFVADKTGKFEYYCSVGKHRAMGMKGTLIVE